jgi:hypothetical protein
MKTDSLALAISTLKDCDARLKLTLAAGRLSADRCAAAIAAQRRALRSVERVEIVGSLFFLVLLAVSLFLSAFL